MTITPGDAARFLLAFGFVEGGGAAVTLRVEKPRLELKLRAKLFGGIRLITQCRPDVRLEEMLDFVGQGPRHANASILVEERLLGS